MKMIFTLIGKKMEKFHDKPDRGYTIGSPVAILERETRRWAVIYRRGP